VALRILHDISRIFVEIGFSLPAVFCAALAKPGPYFSLRRLAKKVSMEKASVRARV
jgi:hypothetical protein